MQPINQRRATSGPRARSGPRRPSVRPATLLGNNIAIRPAKPQPPKNAGFITDVMSVLVKVPQLESQPVQVSARFQALVNEFDVQYGDLLYLCEVRWLSRGAMLSRVCDLQKEIATFLRQNLPYADQFFDTRWLARLALLTDITMHLSALNLKLQGKYILVTDMHAHITAYDVGKPGIVDAQLANGQSEHFPRLAACVPDDVEPDTFVSVSPLWGRNLHPVS